MARSPDRPKAESHERPAKSGRPKSAPTGGQPSKAASRRKAPAAAPGKIVENLPAVPAERDEDGDVLEFLKAIDKFKRKTGRAFPSWTDALEILKSLGYRKG